ncbi:general transcription factor 3C polypeptide 1-like [Antedon mediterranea]|uniref:general transcription factor 3C polypeptide 1-like n=1 Tax=Antedon mediterranea TaxID=105859 RepID=UPI003AF4A5B0
MEEHKQICMDEIALEGLDGITLESLWFRLQDRKPPFRLPIDEYSKPFVWELITSLHQVKFYELPTARPPITAGDGAKEFSEELATYVWFDQKAEPLQMISDEAKGIRGCSGTYHTRQDITSEVRPENGDILSITEAEKRYGGKLVIVASPEARLDALMGLSGDTRAEMSLTSYCTLEYIGKSRHNGRLQTELASALKIDAKGAHYVRRILTSSGIVTKQHLSYFVNTTSVMKAGRILLLSRFHNKLFNTYQFLMEKVSNYLEMQPGRETSLFNIREFLLSIMKDKGFSQQKAKKFYELLKSSGLTTFFMRSRSELYGKLDETKARGRQDRQIRMVKLLKTYAEYTQELDDQEKPEPSACITESQVIAEEPLIMQIYRLFRGGMSKVDISKTVQLSLIEIRRFINKLLKDKKLESYFHSEGKLKYRRYVAIGFPEQSTSEKARIQEVRELNKITELDLKFRNMDNSEEPSTSQQPQIVGKTTENVPQNITPSSNRVSIKQNKRRNIILKELERVKIVNGSHYLKKIIMKKEKEEGYKTSCDRKTLIRMLRRLKDQGLVNIIHRVVPLSEGCSPTELMLITLPNIPENDDLVVNFVKTLQFKTSNQNLVRVHNAQRKKTEKKQIRKLLKTFRRNKTDDENDKDIKDTKASTSNVEVKVSTRAGPPSACDEQMQGYMRKMARARMLYHYIWYLVYAHPLRSKSNILSIDDLGLKNTRTWTRKNKREKHCRDVIENFNKVSPESNEIGELMAMVTESSKDLEEITTSSQILGSLWGDAPKVYNEETSKETMWKKFLPPLPRYNKCAEGWFYVTDLIMIMPLSIFCNLIMLAVKIPNLQEYLNDPIKKHMPLMFLPETLQQQLCYGRKYIHSIHTGLQRLCQMGLLTFGPFYSFFDKDQVFCYLHQKASIVNTTTCEKHYNEVNPGTYQTDHYLLDNEQTVVQFFQHLQVICLNTPLGVTRRIGGKSEDKMMKEIVSVKDISVKPADIGRIPGNGRGAAGLDSSIYTHLRMNWNRPAPGQSSKYKYRQRKQKDIIKTIKKHQAKKASLKGVSIVSELHKARNEKYKGGRGLKRPRLISEIMPKKKPVKRVRVTEKPPVSIGPTTRMILKRSRFDWTEEEDNMMMVFNIANLLLAKRRSLFFISWGHRHDLLMKSFPESKSKSKNALMRRSAALVKCPPFRTQLAMHLSILQKDHIILETLKREVNSDIQEDCENEYNDMVELVTERLRVCSQDIGQISFTSDKFHEENEILTVSDVLYQLPKYKIPQQTQWKTTDEKEIKKLVVRQAVMASFFLIDRPTLFNPSQAFFVFNQFPDDLLARVVDVLKDAYLTTRNRFRHRIRRALPCTAMSLQVSTNCRKIFNSTISTDIFKEMYEYMQSLDEEQYDSNASSLVPVNTTCGQVACFLSMMFSDLVDYNIQMPDQVILLDNSLINKSILERTAKLMRNVHDSEDEDEENEEAQQSGNQSTSDPSIYPLYKRITCIQKISHALEAKGNEKMDAEEPEADVQQNYQAAADFVSNEHSYTQLMPSIEEKVPPAETPVTAPNNPVPTEKEARMAKQQDSKVYTTRTDWFLLQGLGDDGLTEETNGMLDTIMLKPCKTDIKVCQSLKENIHRFNGKTALSPYDLHQMFEKSDDLLLHTLRQDFLGFTNQCDIKSEWSPLEHFDDTKFIPIPLMKKTSMDNIIPTLGDEELILFNLISDKQHLGLMASEILASNSHLSVNILIENLHNLIKKKLIFRVGLDVHRYVAVNYCDLWSITSAKPSEIGFQYKPRTKLEQSITKVTGSKEDQLAEPEIVKDSEVVCADEKVEAVEIATSTNVQKEGGISKEHVTKEIEVPQKIDVSADASAETMETNIQNEFQKEFAFINDREEVVISDAVSSVVETSVQNTNDVFDQTLCGSSNFTDDREEVVISDSISSVVETSVQDTNDVCEQACGISKLTNQKQLLMDNSKLTNQNQSLQDNSSTIIEPSEHNLEDTIGQKCASNTVLMNLSENTSSKAIDNNSELQPVPKMSTRQTRKRKNEAESKIIYPDLCLTKDSEIQFIPRQWYSMGGEVENVELTRLLQKIGLIVISKPGIPEKHIFDQLHLVLSPVECREILQMLQQAGCITRHEIPKLPSTCLFKNFTSTQETEYFYKPTIDCMLRLAAYERYKPEEETVQVENEDKSHPNID